MSCLSENDTVTRRVVKMEGILFKEVFTFEGKGILLTKSLLFCALKG